MMARILVVDDDRSLQRALRVGLVARGHAETRARTATAGLSKVALEQPDVVVLDLGLPDLDGLEVCRRLRSWSEVPVIVLSATGLEHSKVAALDGGADDYVTKPFGMAELEARIRAALRHRRPPEPGEARITVGDLSLDLAHRQATSAGRDLELTSREFDLLAFLARHRGKLCTHQMILGEVWGVGYGTGAEYLRTYVYRLRRKLGDAGGRLLRNAPGMGYTLATDDGRSPSGDLEPPRGASQDL
jgi:two-component system KDP operon response regulator KdpE